MHLHFPAAGMHTLHATCALCVMTWVSRPAVTTKEARYGVAIQSSGELPAVQLRLARRHNTTSDMHATECNVALHALSIATIHGLEVVQWHESFCCHLLGLWCRAVMSLGSCTFLQQPARPALQAHCTLSGHHLHHCMHLVQTAKHD